MKNIPSLLYKTILRSVSKCLVYSEQAAPMRQDSSKNSHFEEMPLLQKNRLFRCTSFSFMLCIAHLFMPSLHAEECTPPPAQNCCTPATKYARLQSLTCLELRCGRYSRLYIGPEFYHMQFQSSTNGMYGGWLGGAEGGYEYIKPNDLYVRLGGYLNGGKLHNSSSLTRTVHEDAIELVFGYNALLGPCDTWRLTPYIGYGFSYISNRLDNAESTASIKSIYQKYYIPVGAQLFCSFYDNFEAGLTFEWMPFVDRTLLRSTTPKIRYNLTSSNGFQIELPFRWYFADLCWGTWDITLIPFWRRNEDGRATALTTTNALIDLPSQWYQDWGGKIYFGYSF